MGVKGTRANLILRNARAGFQYLLCKISFNRLFRYFLQAANVLSLIERLWKHLCSKANDQHLFQTILDLRDGVCSLLYSQPNSNSRSFLSGGLPADFPVLWRDNITFRALPYWRCLIARDRLAPSSPPTRETLRMAPIPISYWLWQDLK